MKNRKIASTKRILKAMLTEYNGIALRDFEHESPVHLEFDAYYNHFLGDVLEVNLTHNVYHWLMDRLTYDSRMDQKFQRWTKRHDPDNNKSWPELMESFTHQDNDRIESCDGYNTYNGDDTLSQILQYELFKYDGNPYVLLQVHSGGDVRGYYTAPRVFALYEVEALFDNAFGSVDCPNCNAYWSTDDSYHWYAGGACGLGAGKQLEKYPAIKQDSEEGWLCAWRLDHGESLDFDHLHNTYDYPERFVFIREDNTAICPLCGTGVLKGY